MTALRNFGAATLALLCCLNPLKAEADILLYDKVSGWDINWFNDEGTKKFIRCGAYKKQGNLGVSVAINSNSKLEIWLFNETWKLTEGQSYTVVGQIDSKPKFPITIEAISQSVGFGLLTDAENTFSQLRRGYNFSINSGTGALSISLKGTSSALSKMRECWDAGMLTLDASNNPFEGSGDSVFSKPDENDTFNAAIFAEFILSEMVPSIEPYDEIPDFLDYLELSLAWPIVGGYGGIADIPIIVSESIVERITAKQDEKVCAGDFGVNTETKIIGSSDVVILKTACSDDGTELPFFNAYTFFPNGKSGSYRVIHSGLDSSEVNRAHTHFLESVTRLVSTRN